MSLTSIFAHLFDGLFYTLLVTIACGLTGFGVGLLVAGLRRLGGRFTQTICDIYTYVLRGVPILVLLFLIYFGLPGLGITVPPLAAMVLSLGLVTSANLAEIFRGAFDAVDPVEVLAAESMGFRPWQTLLYIEIPQMLRFSIPGMVNEFTSVLKYSPFAYTVGIPEITKQAVTLTGITLQGTEVYLSVGILYFTIYRVLLIGVRVLERIYRVPGIRAA